MKNHSNRKYIMKTCPVCGNEYRAKRNSQKYCTRECSSKVHAEWVRENQSGKNNPFYGKKHSKETREKQSRSKRELIDQGWKPASYIDGRSKYLGENHLSKDKEWKHIRKEVLERDKHTCRLCGGAKATHVHHIVPRKIVKEHNKNNLISLCRPCHELTYQREEEFIHVFLGILLREC